MNDDFLTVALHPVKSRMTVHWFPTERLNHVGDFNKVLKRSVIIITLKGF